MTDHMSAYGYRGTLQDITRYHVTLSTTHCVTAGPSVALFIESNLRQNYILRNLLLLETSFDICSKSRIHSLRLMAMWTPRYFIYSYYIHFHLIIVKVVTRSVMAGKLEWQVIDSWTRTGSSLNLRRINLYCPRSLKWNKYLLNEKYS